MTLIENQIGSSNSDKASLSEDPISFLSKDVNLKNLSSNKTGQSLYLLSSQDERFIAEIRECVQVNLYQSHLTSEYRASILDKRKMIGDGILFFLKPKLEILLKPIGDISSTSTLSQCIERIMGTSTSLETNSIKIINEFFNERFILLELLSFLISSSHNYATQIRDESLISEPLAIVDLVGKDSENSWRTLFILFLFDLFFEEEELKPEQVVSNSTINSIFSQIINRWSSIEQTIFEKFDLLSSNFDFTVLETLRFNLQLERLYFIEIVFQCSSKLVPLNVKEWDLFLSTASFSFSMDQEDNSSLIGLLLFSAINGLSFHSTQKPMYDLVRSRLPHRQNYFSTKESWNEWCGKMEQWISHHPWTDPLVKYSLSLAWGLFLRMSREVRTLRGAFLPSKESIQNSNVVDVETAISDSWAMEGILGEKNHLVLSHPKSIFSIFSERFLPSIPPNSDISPWGYIPSISPFDEFFSKWEYFICESLLHLCTSILNWGSLDWIRGKQNASFLCSMASFCDLIGNLFYYPGLTIQSSLDRERHYLPYDTSVSLFWESEKGAFFIRMALSFIGSASTPEVSISVMRMLIGLAQGSIAAMYAFDTLQNSNNESFKSLLTWSHLFTSLQRYQLALALESGEVAPTEISAMEAMFLLLCTICKFQPTFITQLLVNKADVSNMETLFAVLASKVPTSLKAHILTLLGIWIDSSEGLGNSSLVWAYLESSQVIPTQAMDSQVISSSVSFEDILRTPLVPSLGGIVHELMQVEAPVGTYPITISLLRLLSKLLAQRKKDEKFVKSIISSLGVGSRKLTGIWPYLKFVLCGCLVPICTGPTYQLAFLDTEEKLSMVQETISILISLLELAIIPNLSNIINFCGILPVFLGLGTKYGEVLGLPSLDPWTEPIGQEDYLIVRKSNQISSLFVLDLVQLIFTLMKTTKNSNFSKMSNIGIMEEIIVVNRPQFLAILAQIISTSTSLDLVTSCILLLTDLLSIPKIDSILRSVLASTGMNQFSVGIARWFGTVLIEENDLSNNINEKISIIQRHLLSLLLSQVQMSLESPTLMPQSVLLKTNTTALLLGFHRQEEKPSLLLSRLVSIVIEGNFSSSFLLYSIVKSWGQEKLLMSANAIPSILLNSIETYLNNVFQNCQQLLPIILTQIGDTLHLISWIAKRSMICDESYFNCENTIINIFSKLLSIVPSLDILSLDISKDQDEANSYQLIQMFLEGHSHSISGISLLVSEPNSTFINLIVDALLERGKQWSIGIVNSLCDMLSRGKFISGDFIKICSLFFSRVPKEISEYALGCLFNALNLALVKESSSTEVQFDICDSLTQIIINSLSLENGPAACRLACCIFMDDRKIPVIEQLSSSLLSLISSSFKLEEFIRVSLTRSDDDVIYLDLISSLFCVFKNNSQVLPIFIQSMATSGYPSFIHRTITSKQNSLQYLPSLEIAFGLIEHSSLAGASLASILRTNIGQLLPIPLSEIPPQLKENSSLYHLKLSIRMAVIIFQSIALSNQRTSIEVKIISSIHLQCLKILFWLSSSFRDPFIIDSIITRSEMLELLVILLNYCITLNGILSYFDSSSLKDVITETGTIFSIHIDHLSLKEETKFPGLGILFSFLDIFLSNISTNSMAIVGLEHVLLLIWQTLGHILNQPSQIPMTFSSDLRELLLPKIASIISIGSISDPNSPPASLKQSFQFASSLAAEIKNQFLLRK